MKMSFGNEIGFAAENADLDWNTLYPGAIVAELTEDTAEAVRLGVTTAEPVVRIAGDSAPISGASGFERGRSGICLSQPYHRRSGGGSPCSPPPPLPGRLPKPAWRSPRC